ncbi:MAG: methyltransferase domain-containing protein [Patescibacteria group bacterium]
MSEQALRGGTALIDPLMIISRLDIHDGDIVADLGCGGSGHFVGPLAKAVGLKGKVYAVDIQKNVLKVVEGKMKQEHIVNVIPVWSDLERGGIVEIPPESCDLAILINILFQNTKHDRIVQEASRMIKSVGRLMVIDWKTSGSPFGPPSDRRVSPQRVKDIAQELHLSLLDEFDAGPYHYGLIFKK